jgi:hypothetical protein
MIISSAHRGSDTSYASAEDNNLGLTASVLLVGSINPLVLPYMTNRRAFYDLKKQ